MSRCIVIGGGIAGLSVAAYLSKHGLEVTLFESSPKAGGRAYSFKDTISGNVVDNGQHILMGCYNDTLNFLKLIGAKKNFIFSNRLDVNFLKSDGRLFKLKSFPFLYPVNLFIAMLRFKAISFAERISVVKFVLKLPFISHQKLVKKNVQEWLVMEKQSLDCIKSLWGIISVGALNTNVKKASALMFREILMKIFFNGNFASTIILPRYGLTEAYVDPAIKFINTNGGVVKLSTPVEEIIIDENRITGIKIKNGVIRNFDFLISAVPDHSAKKLLPSVFNVKDQNFKHSTIMNIHVWLKQNQIIETFYGLIDSPVHWIFNKKSHLNLVISDADYLLEKSSKEIFEMCVNELEKFLKIKPEEIISYKLIREKKATVVPSADFYYPRPSCETNYSNLFLAGDWTDTGLPSTMESAVKSGRIASEKIINKLS